MRLIETSGAAEAAKDLHVLLLALRALQLQRDLLRSLGLGRSQ